MIWRRVAGASL